MYDTLSKALPDRERRRLLVDLMESNPQADSPLPPEGRQFTPQEEAQQRTALHHKHLPMLESAGFVDWDQEAGEVVKGPAFEDLRPVLQLLHDRRDELPDGWLTDPSTERSGDSP